MAGSQRLGRGLARGLAAGCVALLAAGLLYASRAGGSPTGVLAALDGPVAWLVDAGGAWSRGAAAALAACRLPGLALAVAVALGAAARRGRWSDALLLGAALAIAAIAQSYLMEARPLPGGALYACAAALALARRGAPGAEDPLPPAAEGVAFALLFALVLAANLYALDVFPEAHADEAAHLVASRMRIGVLPRGPILGGLYSFELRAAQPLALSIQAAAVALRDQGILSLRLASVAGGLLAVLAAAFAVRRRVGSRAALWTLLLGGLAPFFLLQSRFGFHRSFSILHAVLCFTALLRLVERRGRFAAPVLGALLGSSLYLYQLSWFVPVLVALALPLLPELWRRRDARRSLAVAGAAALVVVAPAPFLLTAELGDLSLQTFNKAEWHPLGEAGSGAQPQARLLAPEDWSLARARAVAERHRERGLWTSAWQSRTGRAVLVLTGGRAKIEAALARPDLASLPVLRWSEIEATPAGNLPRALAQLFYAPSLVIASLNHVGALDPLLAPFAVLGLAEAVRRRRQPLMRLLAVWCIGAALLPALLTAPLPRRMMLILPFAQISMALAIVELGAALRRLGPPGRVAAGLFSALLLASVVGASAHLYFERWDDRLDRSAHVTSLLELERLARGLPAGRLLAPQSLVRLDQAVTALEAARGAPGRRLALIDLRGPDGEERLRAISCAEPTPFTWITDAASRPDPERVLAPDFEILPEARGPLRLLHVRARLPSACPAGSAGTFFTSLLLALSSP